MSKIDDSRNDEYPFEATEHIAIADAKIESMRIRANHPRSPFWTLTGLLNAWRSLVQEVHEGYALDIYQYTNDLSVRDLLEEVLSALPNGRLHDWLTKEIAETDEQYRITTHEVSAPIAGREGMAWWWHRVPNLLLDELALDLHPDGRH